MTWSLQMKPRTRYSQTVPDAFCITSAALSPSPPNCQANKETDVTLFLEHQGIHYKFAHLQNSSQTVELDLYFDRGEVISFYMNGDANVTLSGQYLTLDAGEGENGEDSFGEEHDDVNRSSEAVDSQPPVASSEHLNSESGERLNLTNETQQEPAPAIDQEQQSYDEEIPKGTESSEVKPIDENTQN